MTVVRIDEQSSITHILDQIQQSIQPTACDIVVEYPSEYGYTKYLREIIGYICDQFHDLSNFKSRAILIADEMNNNAIEYGSNTQDTNTLHFSVNQIEQSLHLTLEVSDSGQGPKAKKALEMETLRAHMLKKGYSQHHSIRGRGLFLMIVNAVDRLYFKDRKNSGLTVGIKHTISKAS